MRTFKSVEDVQNSLETLELKTEIVENICKAFKARVDKSLGKNLQVFKNLCENCFCDIKNFENQEYEMLDLDLLKRFLHLKNFVNLHKQKQFELEEKVRQLEQDLSELKVIEKDLVENNIKQYFEEFEEIYGKTTQKQEKI